MIKHLAEVCRRILREESDQGKRSQIKEVYSLAIAEIEDGEDEGHEVEMAFDELEQLGYKVTED